MLATKWIISITILVLVNGQDEFPTNPDTENYRYHYFVRDENTGDIKSHEEKKLGDTVNGQYTVGEPNGDLRVVTYTADEGGFRANVKYEEGGSPLSDKSSQTDAKSGVDFQWIPGNPDDIGAPAEKTDDENVEQKTEETSTEATTELNSEGTSEKSSSDEIAPSGENDEDKKEPDDEEPKSSSDESKSVSNSESNDSEPKDGDNGKGDDDDKEDDNSTSSEESSDKIDAAEPAEKEGIEESAEAAESAPQSEEVAATEPSQMYLPLSVLPYPNMPFLNMPNEQRENDRPTIIYASQNFYNPWQWFSTKRIVREEQPPLDDEQAGHYMTGLGYIIVPRQQQ